LERHHNRQFKDYMGRFMPDWQSHKRMLNHT
jgi:predicted metal-dependent hydrolase